MDQPRRVRDRRRTPQTFIAAVSWRVGEVVLIHSRFGEGRHEILGGWTLGG